MKFAFTLSAGIDRESGHERTLEITAPAKLVTLTMSVYDRLSTANPFWTMFRVACK